MLSIIKSEWNELFEEFYLSYPPEVQKKALAAISAAANSKMLDFYLLHSMPDLKDEDAYDNACRSGSLEYVQRLEKLGFTPTKHSFYNAVISNCLELIKHLPLVEKINFERISPTYEVFLYLSANMDLTEEDRYHTLRSSAARGDKRLLKHLVDGGQVDLASVSFETVYWGQGLDTLKYMVSDLPAIDIRDNHDATFCWAYQHGYEDFVEYFIDQHAITPKSSPDILDIMQHDNFALYDAILSRRAIIAEQFALSTNTANCGKKSINKL